MSVLQQYFFDDAANFNLINSQIDGAVGKLGFLPNPNQLFSNDFSNDSGFTYDVSKAEFAAGKVQQKDMRPTDSVIGINYNSYLDANWTRNDLSKIAILTGAPVINANRMDVTGGTNRSAAYDNADVGSCSTTGEMKCKYTPAYSGAPPTNTGIMELKDPITGKNGLILMHGGTGAIRLTMFSSTGLSIGVTAYSIVGFAPTAGVEYEFAFNGDTSTGIYSLFIDGIKQGNIPVNTGVRTNTATKFIVGAGQTYNRADGYMKDAILFPTVQHTVNYTKGYTVPTFVFEGSKVDGPNFIYLDVGTIQSFDDVVATEAGTPKFILGGQYWSGIAWVVSDGSYSQANTVAVIIANLGSFSNGVSAIITWSIVFQDSNTISSVDEFSVEVTGQKFSPLGYFEPIQNINVKNFLAYLQSVINTANTNCNVILKIDSIPTWFDGIAWVVSDGTPAQSNTQDEVNDNKGSLSLGGNSTIKPCWVLTSTENNETPEISLSSISFDYGAIETEPITCIVLGYLKNISGVPIENAKLTFSLNLSSKNDYKEANTNVISTQDVETTTDVNGYFDLNLIRSSQYEQETFYTVKFCYSTDSKKVNKSNGAKLSFLVPDSETKDITDLLATAV